MLAYKCENNIYETIKNCGSYNILIKRYHILSRHRITLKNVNRGSQFLIV